MNSSGILSITTFVYGLAGFCYIYAWVFKRSSVGKAGTWVAILGLAGNTAGIALRWVESYQLGIGHAPLSNLYESLVFFAGTIILIYLFIERKYQNRVIGAFTTPFAFLALAYASLSPNISDRIQPLIPALKSNWLIAHVIACFIGYGAFAVACAVGLMYLVKQKSPDYYRRCLGSLRLGPLLGLGPQGNLVADHLVCLRHLAARPDDARLARQAHCDFIHRRVCGGVVYLFRSEPVTRTTQLRLLLTMIFP